MSTQTTKLGTHIGRYRIAELVGEGEVGRVFACKQLETEQTVALKVLRTKYAALGDALMKSRTQLERIESPHVAKIFDIAVFNNVAYVVMELIEGESLAELLKKGALRTVDALALARGILKGLQAAWARGIAHGDVRPANILLPRGEASAPKLVDFLLAAPLEGIARVRGAPAYLAPELIAGTPPDAMSDLYAVGCVLHEAITGKPPFIGTAASVLHAQSSTPPSSLARTMPGAPQGIVDLVDRLLEKDRAQRVKTHGEAIECVERALRGQGMAALLEPAVPQFLDVDMDRTVDGVGDLTAEHPLSPAIADLEPAPKRQGLAAPRDPGVPDFLDVGAERSADVDVEGDRTAVYDMSPVSADLEPGPKRQGVAAPRDPDVPDFLDVGAGRGADVDVEEERTAEYHPSRASASAEPAGRSAKSGAAVATGPADVGIGVYRSSVPQRDEEEKTQVQSGIAPIPSADEVGLVLTPVVPKK